LTSTSGISQLAQPEVAREIGFGVGVQPGDVDDAADAVVEQQLDVFVLVHSPGGLGAQDRRIALPGQR
jgi:hypothetical protein